MLRAISCLEGGATNGPVDDEVTLDFEQRHRRRLTMTGTKGLEFLLDLPRAHRLRAGDALVLEDGRRVKVSAAPEALSEIRAGSADALVRIAWHLGNRHLPVMLAPGKLIIRRDHVIDDMARGLGAAVAHIEGPFDPERGAYAGSDHGHHHGPADNDDGHG